jgi:hypothetical protein
MTCSKVDHLAAFSSSGALNLHCYGLLQVGPPGHPRQQRSCQRHRRELYGPAEFLTGDDVSLPMPAVTLGFPTSPASHPTQRYPSHPPPSLSSFTQSSSDHQLRSGPLLLLAGCWAPSTLRTNPGNGTLSQGCTNTFMKGGQH